MLADVDASFITTAELEMQAAPSSAAATGVPVLPGPAAPFPGPVTKNLPASNLPASPPDFSPRVITKSGLW